MVTIKIVRFYVLDVEPPTRSAHGASSGRFYIPKIGRPILGIAELSNVDETSTGFVRSICNSMNPFSVLTPVS
jgi:hypothetical protein